MCDTHKGSIVKVRDLVGTAGLADVDAEVASLLNPFMRRVATGAPNTAHADSPVVTSREALLDSDDDEWDEPFAEDDSDGGPPDDGERLARDIDEFIAQIASPWVVRAHDTWKRKWAIARERGDRAALLISYIAPVVLR
jgi:hypothetical protein